MSTHHDIDYHVRKILELLGENPLRPGLIDTPKRVAKALREATSGMTQTIDEIVGDAKFITTADDMVIVRNIPFFSTCEHHLMPFEGTVDVGYIPNGYVLGLSKIPRIVDRFAKQLQLQEQLTRHIAAGIQSACDAKGAIVVIRATHTCMRARGIRSDGEMVTIATVGELETSPTRQSHFWNAIGNHSTR